MHAATRRWQRLRRAVGYGALLALIALALLLALLNQLLPVIEGHPREFAQWLGDRVGQSVRFTAIEARWTRRGPRLALEGLEVGEGDRRLAVGRADLQLSIYSGLLPGMPLTELSVDGLDLTLRQDAAGQWSVEGLPKPAQAGVDPLDVLSGFGELRVQGARLHVVAERWRIDHALSRIDLRLRVSGAMAQGGARLWTDTGRAPLDLVVELDRKSGDGTAWLGAERGELAPWSPFLAGLGIAADDGRGSLGAWAELSARRVVAMQVDADLAALALRRLDAALPPVRFESARFAARWTQDGEGWQLSMPTGRFRHEGAEQQIDGLWLGRRGEAFALESARIDAGPLLALGALSNRLSASQAAWVAEAAPGGTVRALVARRAEGHPLVGSARLDALRFAPVGRRPGLSGLGGELAFDADGAALALDDATLTLDWPSELGPPLPVQASGELALWREPPEAAGPGGWGLGTGGLRLAAEGVALQARLALGFQPDGSRPTLDLAVDLDPFDLQAAKRFWPQTAMRPNVQTWLNEALLAGRAEGGRVAIGGDLDDWPFRDGSGRLDARVRLVDTTLRFNAGWPAATDLSVDAIFFGAGLALESLSGQLMGVRVGAAGGSIADFAEPRLRLGVRARSDTAELRRLMMATPLYAPNRTHLDALAISGPADLALTLDLPLRQGVSNRSVQGRLDLDGVAASDRRFDVAFEAMTGPVPFTEAGFEADALAVRYADFPAALSLRVGDRVRDGAHAAEFAVDTTLAPQTLLQRVPDLDWLSPWLEGRSRWQVQVDVPKGAAARAETDAPPPSVLRLSSDLVGTRIGLPAPLRKNAATALPLLVTLPLPAQQGELQLALGRLLRLRARLGSAERPFAGVAEFGSTAVGTAYPVAGLAVRGQASSLDIAGWVALAAGADGAPSTSAIASAPAAPGARRDIIDSVDLTVGGIDVLDRSFGEGRVTLTRSPEAFDIGFAGPAIAGSVRVPVAEGAAIDGRFARLHWPAVDARAVTGAAGEPEPAVDDTDPSRLPPLRFRFDDFRLGQARLGRADLVTFPTPEGLHVDRFSTDSDALKVSADGDWTLIGGRTRSRFAVDFDAPSLGAMLDALGFTGMVEDGPVKARMVGDWPGSPGSFRLDRYDGSLRVDVGEGRLLDVEPGTGRFLGLVSIAEIPRRLTLDFSDFFAKGFAFNAMSGDFAFDEGLATTANLRIDGPAAEINVTGTTALSTREYDQRVEVLPKAGGMLPALGAVTAGPAGAAIGAVAQAVLQIPLKQATRTVYTVQGPWAKPQVDVVERGPRRSAPTPPSAAGAKVRGAPAAAQASR